VNWSGVEQITDVDLNAAQDRLFQEIQRRTMAILGAGLDRGLEQAQGSGADGLFTAGVLSGLMVGSISGGSSPVVGVFAGEAVVKAADGTFGSDESRFRLARISPDEGMPPSRYLTLGTPDATWGRLDVITIAPAVASLAADTFTVPKKVNGVVQWTSTAKQTRASATLRVYQGTPSSSPALPVSAPSRLSSSAEAWLAVVWVPVGGDIRVMDARTFAHQSLAFAHLHGRVSGFQFSIGGSPTQFKLGEGIAFLDGRIVAHPIRTGFSDSPSSYAYIGWKAAHDAGDSSTPGWRYVYLSSGYGSMSDGADRIVVSNIAPDRASSRPVSRLAYTAAQNPVCALSTFPDSPSCVYLGRILVDGTNITSAVADHDDRVDAELHQGIVTFTAANAHQGAETHSGPEAHTGAETHSGPETHAGAETFVTLAVSGAETHGGAETHSGSEAHGGPEVHNGTETHTGLTNFTGGLQVSGVPMMPPDFISGAVAKDTPVANLAAVYKPIQLSSAISRSIPASACSLSSDGLSIMLAPGLYEVVVMLARCYLAQTSGAVTVYLNPGGSAQTAGTTIKDVGTVVSGASDRNNTANALVPMNWTGVVDLRQASGQTAFQLTLKTDGATCTVYIGDGTWMVRRIG
jgi:hypothetical protein